MSPGCVLYLSIGLDTAHSIVLCLQNYGTTFAPFTVFHGQSHARLL